MKSICEWSELLYKDVTETPNIIPVTDSYGNGEYPNVNEYLSRLIMNF
jgi:hypothetical protein